MSIISNNAAVALATSDLAIGGQPSAKSLDKIYTKSDIARQCVDDFERWTSIDLATATTDIIEPSAGAGAFLDFLPARTLAYDLAPEDARIATQDFLALKRKKSAIVIGNPPFGTACGDAIKFFEHSATFASYIAYVVPRTFEKDSIQNKLDENFHLLYERVLPPDSFTFEGKTKSVPCVFQIWERRADKRSLVKLPITHPDFEFVDREKANFAVQRVGVNAGQIKPSMGKFADSSHYFLRATGSAEELMMLLLAIDFSLAKARNSGVPSIGKTEVVALYSALKKAAVNDPHPPNGAGQKGDSVEYGTQGLYYGPENLAALRCETPLDEGPRVEQEELRRAGLLERIDLRPDPVKRAKLIDGDSFDRDGGRILTSATGRAATSPKFGAGRLGLQHGFALCDAAVMTRRAEPAHWHHIGGKTLFPQRLPLDASSLIPFSSTAPMRLPGNGWRKRMSENGGEALRNETIKAGTRAGAAQDSDLARVTINTAVMEKRMAHPPDARLYETARRKRVGMLREAGLRLRQSPNRLASGQVERYACARPLKLMRRAHRRLAGTTAHVLRDIERQLKRLALTPWHQVRLERTRHLYPARVLHRLHEYGVSRHAFDKSSEGALRPRILKMLALMTRLLAQKVNAKNKLRLNGSAGRSILKGRAYERDRLGYKISRALIDKAGCSDAIRASEWPPHTTLHWGNIWITLAS